MTRIGSLCTGYGGLDMAVRAAFGGEVAFVADPDPGAAKILAHHHPEVPNLGDITALDWSGVEPVDVLTAGFPCQDISNAGKRAGIGGDRSGIWSNVADAVRVLRPGVVYLENVAALLVRGLDRVAADLAALGYDATWTCLRASDAGAPHRRERIFILAWPAAEDTDVAVGGERRLAAPGPAAGRGARADLGGRGRAFAPDTDGVDERPLSAGDRRGQPQAPIGDRGAPAADPAGDGRNEGRAQPEREQRRPDAAVGGGPDWGEYAPAIRRWERVTGHAASVPTEPGRGGRPRMSPRFVEWLMGLPVGFVTAPEIGLSRAQQLHALGNGVVPQQGELALRLLLERAADPVTTE